MAGADRSEQENGSEPPGVEHQPRMRCRAVPQCIAHADRERKHAIGETSPVVMAELGHTDPELALSIYAHAMRRDDGENDIRRTAKGRVTNWERGRFPLYQRGRARYARKDSNLRPLPPEGSALSTELRAREKSSVVRAC